MLKLNGENPFRYKCFLFPIYILCRKINSHYLDRKKNLRWNAKACSTLKTKKHHRETDGQWNQEASISIKAESDPILRPQWNTRAHITTLFAFTGHIRTNQISPIIFPPINLFFLFFYFSLQHLYSFINKKNFSLIFGYRRLLIILKFEWILIKKYL